MPPEPVAAPQPPAWHNEPAPAPQSPPWHNEPAPAPAQWQQAPPPPDLAKTQPAPAFQPRIAAQPQPPPAETGTGWGVPQGYPPPPHVPSPHLSPRPAPPQSVAPRTTPQTWPPPPARSGLPTWALTLIFAAAFIGIGSAVYFGIQRFSRTNPGEKAGLQAPGGAAAKVSNPLQKYVEVIGIRIFTEKSKPVVRFVVVNHSNTEISDLGANVTLWASTSRSEEDAVGSFSFKAGTLGPEESKELTEPFKTKLKVYELPDWQNTTAEINITSPQP